MGTALFTTAPYIEMAISAQNAIVPHTVEGVVTWSAPLADGAMVLVSLDDCEYYVRWLFDNPKKSDGMDLEVAADHIIIDELAQAFQKVTGKPAKYIDIPLSTYFDNMLAQGDILAGYNVDPKDPATMTAKQNFTGFRRQGQVVLEHACTVIIVNHYMHSNRLAIKNTVKMRIVKVKYRRGNVVVHEESTYNL